MAIVDFTHCVTQIKGESRGGWKAQGQPLIGLRYDQSQRNCPQHHDYQDHLWFILTISTEDNAQFEQQPLRSVVAHPEMCGSVEKVTSADKGDRPLPS